MPLYPTEDVIWNEAVAPNEYNDKNCSLLPKLSLQFLTIYDYLYRNFQLFKLEFTCKLYSLLLYIHTNTLRHF